MITNLLAKWGITLPIPFMLLVVIVIVGMIVLMMLLTFIVSKVRRR
jgi:hypothetical protein